MHSSSLLSDLQHQSLWSLVGIFMCVFSRHDRYSNFTCLGFLHQPWGILDPIRPCPRDWPLVMDHSTLPIPLCPKQVCYLYPKWHVCRPALVNHDEWVCGTLHQIQSAPAPPTSISASLKSPFYIKPQTSTTHPWFVGLTINVDSVRIYLTESHFIDHRMHDICVLYFIIINIHLYSGHYVGLDSVTDHIILPVFIY